MLMADAVVRPWTREELARLPDDGNRYEVFEGELFVTPAPTWRHQGLAAALSADLHFYCRTNRIGMVASPGAIIWSGNELLPDVLVCPGSVEELTGRGWTELPTPILVVEIESESSLRRDRAVKRTAYVDTLGIAAYWLVDPKAETIRVIAPNAVDQLLGIGDVLTWSPDPAIVPFTLALESLFHPES